MMSPAKTVVLYATLLQLLWSTTVHCLSVEMIPNESERSLLPGKWTTHSVLACATSLLGVTSTHQATLHYVSGSTTKRTIDEVSSLDYFVTRNNGYSLSVWLNITSTEEGLECREIITRFYNNQTLGLSAIGIRINVRNESDQNVRKFKVTFKGESEISPPTTTTITTDGTTTTDVSQSPGVSGSLGTTPTSTVIGVVVTISVVAVGSVAILAACLLVNRRTSTHNLRHEEERAERRPEVREQQREHGGPEVRELEEQQREPEEQERQDR